jgi:cyclohexyl-isocyanide hydratase
MTTYSIGIPIVTNFDMMDVANPYEIFCWQRLFVGSERKIDVLLVGHERGANVTAFNGASLQTHASFDDLAGVKLDMIFVPGGGDSYIDTATSDGALLGFVQQQAGHAQFVASVCTGAFVLAKAGLLDGRRATTHWNYLARLQQEYPAIQVVNGFPRYVHDDRVVTGGGISSGIDLALTLAGKIAGEQAGRDIELAIQYRPQPPYGTGDPSIADYATWKEVTTDLA